MKKYFCDKCGKEDPVWRRIVFHPSFSAVSRRKLHLCSKCVGWWDKESEKITRNYEKTMDRLLNKLLK